MGLYTITPKKLTLLFPDIGLPQLSLAWKLHKTLGALWIEKAREIYSLQGSKETGTLTGYKNRQVIEALMPKLASLSH